MDDSHEGSQAHRTHTQEHITLITFTPGSYYNLHHVMSWMLKEKSFKRTQLQHRRASGGCGPRSRATVSTDEDLDLQKILSGFTVRWRQSAGFSPLVPRGFPFTPGPRQKSWMIGTTVRSSCLSHDSGHQLPLTLDSTWPSFHVTLFVPTSS